MTATELNDVAVGDRVWFASEKLPYTVRARGSRYIICTKPFAAQRTVLYSIIDIEKGIRGPDDRVFCRGYEKQEHCRTALADLEAGELDVSRRRSIALDVVRVAPWQRPADGRVTATEILRAEDAQRRAS